MPKAYIIGLGRSGIAAAKLLKQDGWQVILGDRNISTNLESAKANLETLGIEVKLGYTANIEENKPDLIVVSPGVPWDIPLLVAARNQGIDTIGELELAWRYLKSSPWIGITGTNGKTTTTALLAAIFQAAGLNAPACGNIGYAACELALETNEKKDEKKHWIISEISSYQIESCQELSPKIGIWTTFTPDHLNRHKSLENYYQIKASLLKRSVYKIINGDDPYLHNIGVSQWGDAYWTSITGKNALIGDPSKGVYIENGLVIANGQRILPISSFKMVGEHNQQNLLMAVAAACIAGIDSEAIALGVREFPGVPHRLVDVCGIDNIKFINDSKATNYDAAKVGLDSVDAPVILIAGGEAKEGDDHPWLKMIQAKVATVLLIGEAASSFALRLQKFGYSNYEIVETMDRAVARSLVLAKQYHASTVLLSPACASFDQYQSFEHRGDHFRELCIQVRV